MTAQEMIDHLSGLPQDVLIFMPDWNEDYRSPVEIGGTSVLTEGDWDAQVEQRPAPEGFVGGYVVN